MAPSTEHIDDLLEWHPGTPEAARTNPLSALLWGARRAGNAKILIGWLWLAHLLLSGGSAALAPETAGAAYFALLAQSSLRPLWRSSAYFLLFYGLVPGGAIAYLHAPRPAPLLAQFGAGCGIYLGRFLRLLAVSAAVSWLLWYARTGGAVVAGVPAQPPSALSFGLWQGTLMLLAAVTDYARVRTVLRDSRSMLLETARSALFFVRYLPRLLALEVALLLIGMLAGALVAALGVGLRSFLSPAVTSFIAAQSFVIALLWVRLAGWGAMLSLYQGLVSRSLARR